MNSWKILIVTNGKIVEDYYKNDPKFNAQNWSFFNVGKENIQHSALNVINSSEIDGYEYLGKEWAESEVIYNISKLGLFKEFDYLGIIHWDFNLYSKDHETYRITENIENILGKFEAISFFPGLLKHITGFYDVLLDERKPNCLFVRNSGLENPKSSLEKICEVIGECDNERWHEEKPFEIIKGKTGNELMPLCCSFLAKREHVDKMGRMIGRFVSEDAFRGFDVEKRHRIQGQVMERLVAVYFLLKGMRIFPFRLDHKFTGGLELNRDDPQGEDY